MLVYEIYVEGGLTRYMAVYKGANLAAEYREKVLIGLTDLNRHNKHGLVKFGSNTELFEYYWSLIDTFDSNEVLLIYNSNSDKEMAYAFSAYVNKTKQARLKIANIQNEFQLVDLISNAKLVISPRMHSCIVAYSYCVKCIPVIISDKMKVFQSTYCENINNVSDLVRLIYSSCSEITL